MQAREKLNGWSGLLSFQNGDIKEEVVKKKILCIRRNILYNRIQFRLEYTRARKCAESVQRDQKMKMLLKAMAGE
jgi:hypothetical protein